MTRNEMKKKIAEIIWDIEPKTMEEAYIEWDDACDAAEEIMKLWDQGFVYELEDKK